MPVSEFDNQVLKNLIQKMTINKMIPNINNTLIDNFVCSGDLFYQSNFDLKSDSNLKI